MMRRNMVFGLILGLGCQTLAAWADDVTSAISHPTWEERDLGRVHYSSRDNERRGDEDLIFRINEDGVVSGADLLNAVPAMAFEQYQFLRQMGLNPDEGAPSMVSQSTDLQEQYQSFFQRQVDQSMAKLVMARILDHEAMKRMMTVPEPSNGIVSYIVSSILTQNALALGAPLSSEAEMYLLLKRQYGEQELNFNIDWKFIPNGLGEAMRELRSNPNEPLLYSPAAVRGPVQIGLCPASGNGLVPAVNSDPAPVRIGFGALPRNLRLFRAAIKSKLQVYYQPALRTTVWQRIVSERNPMMRSRLEFAAPTQQEVERLYPMMRESALIRTDRNRVEVLEIQSHGEKGDAFNARFMIVMDEKAQAFRQALFSDGRAAQEQTPELEAQLRRQIIEWRKTATAEAFAQVRGEFAADIASGALSAALNACIVETNAAQLAQNASIETTYRGRAERAILSEELSATLLPVISGGTLPQGGPSAMMAVITDQQALEPTYIEAQDPRIRQILRERTRARELARVYRQTAYELFSENPFEFQVNTCDALWPCATSHRRSQAVRWTDLLFQEFLFPEMTLPVEASRLPLQTSTLLRPEYFDRVMTLSTEEFDSVIHVPNTHVDRVLRFFPGLRQTAQISREQSGRSGSLLGRILGQRSVSCGPNGCGF